ncbi:(2Fe-2S)-binding protein [Paenibacillus wynnii]|uniref:(2Fe-2S)-binding protein n=1 Tax=Paenibacillus wynnii TaxID=268407 RepID=UPI002790AFE0|nr:(2Fe-2S)-binding protein [Paenibacillus wynnii]MDQ0193353.1 ferric iron reductase protein FhuF [Paenibacillus wynnii]
MNDTRKLPDLLKEQLETRYDISLVPSENRSYYTPVTELLHEEGMTSFLNKYTVLIRGVDRTAAATFLAGWFGSVGLALQYAISVHETEPDFSLDNLFLDLVTKDNKTRLLFRPLRWSETACPGGETQRLPWRAAAISGFYSGQARPLLESLSFVSGIPIGQLWGQWPTRFYREISGLISEERNEQTKHRLLQDYQYLREGLEPSAIFGRANNPFAVKIRQVEPLSDPNRLTAIKSACCLNYRTEGSDFCYTCPRLSEEQRAVKREEYQCQTGKG